MSEQKKLFSFSIPDMEIHNSKDPIALMFTPSGQIFPYKIKAKDRYFVINEKKIKGIFTLNNKYRFSWGRTPVYCYMIPETNPVDPILINELNQYKKKNKLTTLTTQDIKHGSRLRILRKQSNPTRAMNQLKEETMNSGKEMSTEITNVTDAIDKKLDNLKTMHQKEVDVSGDQKAFVLLEHLKQGQKIDELQYTDLSDKISTNMISFENLVDDLRNMNIVSVSEPLDENVEGFVKDLGGQDARSLASFVEDLRSNKKGLKDMTSTPVRSWMPAGYILAGIIGIAIMIPILVMYGPQIGNLTGGDGGFALPGVNMDMFNPGGFIFKLKSFMGI